MGFDISALAPGPAGTSMIGESNIDAAARRARERLRREAEEKGAEKGDKGGTDDQSEQTLGVQAKQKHEPRPSHSAEDTLSAASTQVPAQSESDRDKGPKGHRRAWENIKKKLSRSS